MISLDIVTILKDNKLKVTKGRIDILEVIINNNCRITAEYIYDQCKKKGNDINLSTVYRTLETLEDKEIINKFDLGDGKYNYVLKDNIHKHILQCNFCHKEVEIDCPMTQIELIIKNKTGFIPIEHELKIKGICEQCKDDFIALDKSINKET